MIRYCEDKGFLSSGAHSDEDEIVLVAPGEPLAVSFAMGREIAIGTAAGVAKMTPRRALFMMETEGNPSSEYIHTVEIDPKDPYLPDLLELLNEARAGAPGGYSDLLLASKERQT